MKYKKISNKISNEISNKISNKISNEISNELLSNSHEEAKIKSEKNCLFEHKLI
jgi:hypothetical protein